MQILRFQSSPLHSVVDRFRLHERMQRAWYVLILTCDVDGSLERTYLGLKKARRAKVPGNFTTRIWLVGGDCHTHQALNTYLFEQYAKLHFFFLNILAVCRLCDAHVRKHTRLSPLFHTASDEKLGGAWERG